MALTLTHPFVSGKSDGSDASLVQPSNWNAGHVINGGAKGDLLVYDATQTSHVNGVPAVAVGQVLVSAGVTTLPAWSATPSLTSLTLADAGVLTFGNRGSLRYAGDGIAQLLNNAGTAAVRWIIGANDATANGASLLLNIGANELIVKTGDASAFKNFAAARINGSSLVADQFIQVGTYVEGVETTPPGAGAVNTGRLYFDDNGSGKTRLMCVFNTGAAQQIAIQP